MNKSNSEKIDDSNISNWGANKCKLFLKDHKALKTGNIQILRQRCVLLQKLIEHDLQRVMSLAMNELRGMCVKLSVQQGNKDEMTRRVSSVLLNEDNPDVDCVLLMLISIDD